MEMQSTYFVNNSLAKGGLTNGFEGLPLDVPVNETLDNQVINSKIAKSLVGTYLKNNWVVMLGCAIVGGTLIYVLYKIDEGNRKRRTKK